MSLHENKRLLRRSAQEKRKKIILTCSINSGKFLAENIIKLLSSLTKAHTVSGYLPIGDEIDTLQSLTALANTGYQTCLPVVIKNDYPLDFRSWVKGNPLECGPLKTRHPSSDAVLVNPDVLLVPLLAYDDNGNRLGWGGGFYDRTLGAYEAEGRSLTAIGVCYAEQRVEYLPFDAFDKPMDWIVTEKQILKTVKADA